MSVKLVSLGEDEIQIEFSGGAMFRSFGLAGRVYPVTVRDGKSYLPARLLWDLGGRPGLQLSGYGPSTEGWRDPVAFLREHGAAWQPLR